MTAVFFTLEIASSFISFGALIAFTFVNLSVIAHYALKNKEYKSPISFLTNVIIPVIGAAFVAVLWYNLESSSFTMGMIWLGLGVIYLLYVTKMFKVQPMDIHFEEAGESTYIEENETPAVTREA